MTSKPHIAHHLLSQAHPPETASALFTDRIQHKPLFLRPTSPTPTDNRNRRRHHRLQKKAYFLRHQKPRPLSAREKRASGIYDLPSEECKYEIFLGLHKLWVEYMQEVLDLKNRKQKQAIVTPTSYGAKLVSADMHGAMVEVVRSRASGRVGLKGIVVRDTKFTFLVVGVGDVVKLIPKEHTIFRFTVPVPVLEDDEGEGGGKELVFELHGSQFENRPVDRANRKFKWRNVDYL